MRLTATENPQTCAPLGVLRNSGSRVMLPTMIALIYEFYEIIIEIIEFKKEVENE